MPRRPKLTIVSVVGARPNFMKIAPLDHAFKKSGRIRHILVHTGQHYDAAMSDGFFRALGIHKPEHNLGVGSGSHGEQTARIMVGLEPLFMRLKPDAVLVVGDVNSTVAASLVAAKLGIPVIHVEAGLRSGDRTMPEEINRIVTDQLSDFLFVTGKEAITNLTHEGVSRKKIFFVGNVMVDTLFANLKKAKALPTLKDLGLKKGHYVPLTLHRPSNVDNPAVLKGLLKAIGEIQQTLPIIWPVHPRTQKMLTRLKLQPVVDKMENVHFIPSAGYLDFLNLTANAAFVLTDSGGIQEETTALGISCLTLRENTERPITLTQGTNTIVGTDPATILRVAHSILSGKYKKRGRIPPLWDGRAAERITQILLRYI